MALNVKESINLDEDTLKLIWIVPDGIIISDSTNSSFCFFAPEVFEDTTYQFILEANDGTESDFDTVDVTIQNSNILIAKYNFSENANDESGKQHHGIVHNVAFKEDRFTK